MSAKYLINFFLLEVLRVTVPNKELDLLLKFQLITDLLVSKLLSIDSKRVLTILSAVEMRRKRIVQNKNNCSSVKKTLCHENCLLIRPTYFCENHFSPKFHSMHKKPVPLIEFHRLTFYHKEICR